MSADAPLLPNDASRESTGGSQPSDDPPPPPLCVLRPFRTQDQLQVKEIIAEATMETVGEFFWAAVFSELFPEISFVAIAVGFVGFGLPFYFCLSLVPVAVALLYVFIWSAHMMKVLELHDDLHNVAHSYQQDADTGFWVAEVYETFQSSELAAHFNKTKKVLYEFITEEALDRRGDNLARYRHRTVAGCVALTHSHHSHTKAWLRRFAVKKEYQRRAIATNLLELVIAFCRGHEYTGLELITTHCHHKARNMYQKTGFMVTMNTRYLLNVAQPTYLFWMPLQRPAAAQAHLKEGRVESPAVGLSEGNTARVESTRTKFD